MIVTVKRYDVQILKGVVNAAVGQENGSREHLKIAQQYFQLVGGKSSSTGFSRLFFKNDFFQHVS